MHDYAARRCERRCSHVRAARHRPRSLFAPLFALQSALLSAPLFTPLPAPPSAPKAAPLLLAGVRAAALVRACASTLADLRGSPRV